MTLLEIKNKIIEYIGINYNCHVSNEINIIALWCNDLKLQVILEKDKILHQLNYGNWSKVELDELLKLIKQLKNDNTRNINTD